MTYFAIVWECVDRPRGGRTQYRKCTAKQKNVLCIQYNMNMGLVYWPIHCIWYGMVWYSKCTDGQRNVPCTQHSIFWGLAGSHLHADFSKTTGFLAPAYVRPPSTATAYGGADSSDAPADKKRSKFEPYPPS